MSEDVTIPTDTLMRMALIAERDISNKYDYMKVLVSAHERELMELWLCVFMLTVVNVGLVYKIYYKDKANGIRSK